MRKGVERAEKGRRKGNGYGEKARKGAGEIRGTGGIPDRIPDRACPEIRGGMPEKNPARTVTLKERSGALCDILYACSDM